MEEAHGEAEFREKSLLLPELFATFDLLLAFQAFLFFSLFLPDSFFLSRLRGRLGKVFRNDVELPQRKTSSTAPEGIF